MYLLDTDTLTHLYAGNPRVALQLRTVDDPNVGTTVITKVEILRGRIDYLLKAETGDQLLRGQELLIRTEGLGAQILIVPINSVAAQHFDRLRSIRSLRKIGRADILIASVALANRAILVTRNLRHFKQIPGVVVVNWVD